MCMILAFPLRPFAYLLISGYFRSHSKRKTDVKSVATLFLGVEGSATSALSWRESFALNVGRSFLESFSS